MGLFADKGSGSGPKKDRIRPIRIRKTDSPSRPQYTPPSLYTRTLNIDEWCIKLNIFTMGQWVKGISKVVLLHLDTKESARSSFSTWTQRNQQGRPSTLASKFSHNQARFQEFTQGDARLWKGKTIQKRKKKENCQFKLNYLYKIRSDSIVFNWFFLILYWCFSIILDPPYPSLWLVDMFKRSGIGIGC